MTMAGGDRTEITDKDGKITVPPLNEKYNRE